MARTMVSLLLLLTVLAAAHDCIAQDEVAKMIGQPEGENSLPVDVIFRESPHSSDTSEASSDGSSAAGQPEGESSKEMPMLSPPALEAEDSAADSAATEQELPSPPPPPVDSIPRKDALASLEEAQLYLQRARVMETTPECKSSIRDADASLTWSVALLVESKYNESVSRLESSQRSLGHCASSLAAAAIADDAKKPVGYLVQQARSRIDESLRSIRSLNAPPSLKLGPPAPETQIEGEGYGGGRGGCRLDGTTCQYSPCGRGKHLSQCGVGFARGVTGGARGISYTVTDASDQPSRPSPGSFRYGVQLANKRNGGVWITFARSMVVHLRDMVWIRSSTTVDGRGANVTFTGHCLVVGGASNVILHNFAVGGVPGTDTVHIFGGSRGIWVDHITSWSAKLGLVSVVQGSTDVTISNCYLSNPNFNMLLGASDADSQDRNMRVTVFRNWFKDSMQRMPHCRWGYCHVVNNYYTNWGYYAIGGRAHAQILSENNVFVPGRRREVTPWFPGASGAVDQTSTIVSKNDLYLGGSTFHQFVGYRRTGAAPRYTSVRHYPPAVSTKKLARLVQNCAGSLSGHKLRRCLFAAA